jgi:hypothetical protein
MKTIRVSIDPDNSASLPEGRVDFNRFPEAALAALEAR